MKRLIGCMAALCLVALTVGCGGVQTSDVLAYVSNSTGTGFTVFNVNTNATLTEASISPQSTPVAPKVLQFSPNGRWVYFLDAAGSNIYAFTRAGNGTLAVHIDTVPVTGTASSLVISPNSQFLYVSLPGAVSQGVTGAFAIYRIDQLTGDIFQVSSNVPVGFAITQLQMSPDGAVLYALAPAQQTVLTFTLNSSSGLATGPNTFPVGPTPPCFSNPATAPPPCTGMILSANGKFLYVVDTSETSTFTTNGSVNGTGVTITGQSPNIFGFTTSSSGILTTMGPPFHENADLTPLAGTPPSPALFPTNPVAGVTSSDSRFLFIANQGTHNISVFRIDTVTGSLNGGQGGEVTGTVTSVGGVASTTQSPFDCGTGCSTPDFLAVPRTNNALYVLDTNAAKIFEFFVDQNTGRLRPLAPGFTFVSAGPTPTWITIR